MKKLGYTIPTFQMKRRLSLEISADKKNIEAMGVDSNGTAYTIFTDMKVDGLGPKKSIKRGKQPYQLPLPADLPKNFTIELSFQRHYAEPDVHLSVDTELLIKSKKLEYLMNFDAGKTGNWDLILVHDANREVVGAAEFK